MEKEILKRGYITHCLTNSRGEFYNKHQINWKTNEIEKNNTYYWSEVYCEPDYLTILIRRGELLVNPTWQELEKLNNQSIINCQQ